MIRRAGVSQLTWSVRSRRVSRQSTTVLERRLLLDRRAAQWLQSLVHVLPLYYLSDALHQILNDGSGLPVLDLAVLVAWAVVCFAIAVWRFRWE